MPPKKIKRLKSRRNSGKSLTARRIFNYFLLVAVVSLTLGGALRLLSLWSTRSWRAGERFTVVVEGKTPAILSHQDNSDLFVIPLPPSLEVVGAYEVGELTLGNLYEFGEVRGIGGKLLIRTLQSSFGFPVDGFIVEDVVFENGKISPSPATLFGLIFMSSKNSNLNFFDRVKLSLVLGTIEDKHIRVLSLEKLGMVGKSGGRNVILTDAVVPREITDVKIADEGIGVGILNKAGKSGLARRVSRIVEGLGAPVLWVRTEDNFPGRCTIRTSSVNEDSLTVRKIRKLFDCELSLDPKLSSSAELILGAGIAQEFP